MEQFQEQLTALGDDGWRVVAATPGGDTWSAVLEQEAVAIGRGTDTGQSRIHVEVRDADENVNTVVLEADGLAVVDGVVYLRRVDEVLATYSADNLVTVTWGRVRHTRRRWNGGGGTTPGTANHGRRMKMTSSAVSMTPGGRWRR